MIFTSPTISLSRVQDGQNGQPGVSSYVHIKYSDDMINFTADSGETIGKYIGMYTDHIEQDSTTFSDYSWSQLIADNAYTVVMTNESFSFATDNNRLPLSSQSAQTGFIILHGTDPVTDYTIGAITTPSGITSSVSNKVVTFSVNTTDALPGDYGQIAIVLTIDGNTVTKYASWTVSKKGDQGSQGPVGPPGSNGVGISNSKEQWYLSSSKSELLDGTWSDTEPTTIPDGKYLWGRIEFTMSDGSTQHSAAVHRSTIQEIKNITDSINRSITQKVWQSDITTAIDDYDGTTAQSIRDDVSQLTTDLSGIETRVGKAETTLTTKADGSTVTTLQNDYSAFKQTMNGFKTTVEFSYATIKDLNSVKVSGNNLYHIRDEVSGYIHESSGGIVNPSSTYKERTSAYIPIIPGATYIVQSWATPDTDGGSWLAYQFYTDESADAKIGSRMSKYGSDTGSGVEITAEGQEHLMYKVIAPENANYIRVSYRHFEDGCCMVEQATIPSEYAIAPVDIEYESDAKITSARTIAEQAADKFTWLVESGTSASNFTLTSRVAELISPQVVIKDPAGSATIITGGKIQANAITADMLAADAIKSRNYRASTNVQSPYSAFGTFLDLSTGTLYMPNFGVNGTTGEAYFNGTVNASSGTFGDNNSYWNIETVQDYNMDSHAALVGTGNAYLQTGNWQVSDNTVATRKYTSTSESSGNATYYKDSDSNTFYDVGMKIPSDFSAYSASDSSVTKYNKAFYYGRKYTGNNAPSLDSDWTYFFSIDSGGNVITAGDVYEGGIKLSEKYAAITDVGSAYLPKTGGTITGNLLVNGSFTTNLMLQTNLGSTSSAQLTGAANAIVKPGVTGTLGVGNGGTGKSSWTQWGIVYASATNTLAQIGAGTSGQVLRSNGGAAPSWTNQSALSVGSAIKATQDADGNVISSTYRKLDNGVFDTMQVTDLTAGDLMVTGVGRFTNGLYGNLTGSSTKVKDSGNGTDITFAYSKSGLSSTSWFAAWDGFELRAINPANALSTLGALPLTGGTITGTINAKFTNIDASKSNNNVSADTYPTTFSILDTASRILARMEAVVHPTGGIDSYWYVRNYKTDGTMADQKGIRMSMDKTGVLTYTVDDADKFRTAIGLGNVNNTADSNKNVLSASKWTTGRTLTVGKTGKTVNGTTDVSWSLDDIASAATTSTAGWMSAADKSKLDSITVTSGGTIEANNIVGANGISVTLDKTTGVATVKHANSAITAGTASGTATSTLTNGGSFNIPTVTYDAYGHITAKGTTTLTLPNITSVSGNAGTATKFAAAQSVTLTGDTTGTASSQAGWSITTKTVALSTKGRQTSMDINFNDAQFKSKLTYMHADSNTTTHKPPSDCQVLNFGWDNGGTGTWGAQLAIGAGSQPRIYTRGCNGSNGTWDTAWQTVLDSTNYTSYTVTKTGSGATGTWGINISGSAGSAASATKATQDSDGNAINTTYMKKSGGTFTGEIISQSGGIWVQGNSAAGGNYNRLTLTSGMPTEFKYNGGKRGTKIYSNAIAFADPYNGNSNNDAGWIRHIEETVNVGTLEIATGDDANELIKVRQYNTSSAIAHEMTLLDSSGNTAISGRLTIGSSTSAAANTCQLVMNTSTHSLDFVFN